MFRISVQSDKGTELEISKGNHVYYKRGERGEVYRDWQEVKGRQAELEEIFEEALQVLERIKKTVPE